MHLIKRQFLALCRTLHVYLTLLGLLVMLLFGVTGFTVNHEDWFGATRPVVTETAGQLPPELARTGDALHVVEHLRQAYHIRGAMTDYDATPDRISVAFKEPGQTWEIVIERADGRTSVHAEAFNFAAVINNLHRGRYAGPAWRWVIDLTALAIVVACVTGIVLWLALPKRRVIGLVALGVGILGTLLVIRLLVPGPDNLPAADQASAAKAR